jgi:uncharacterized protein YbjT (DUF2867 family)
MSYVVLGVTGNTGKIVAESLLSAGKKVRGVVRDASKGAALKAKGAEIAVADVSDASALAKALEGAEGAYVLTPPSMTEPDFRAYQSRVVDALAAAIRTAKPAHVVLLSSVGAQHEGGTGPIAALGRAERVFREIPGVAFTFLRAGYFMENLGGALGTVSQGFIPSFFPKDFPVDMIATADIGKVVGGLLAEGAKGTSVVELGGPAVTMDEVAAAVSRIVGKPVRVEEAPVEAVAPTFTGFGMPADLAGLYQEMIGAIRSGRVKFEGTHRRVLGTTSVETVLRGLLGAS